MVSRPAALSLLSITCLVLAGTIAAPGAVIPDHRATASGQFQEDSPVYSDWVLTLDGPAERSAVGEVGLDVGQSISTQRSAAVLRLNRIELQQRLDAAPTDEDRFEILRSELDSLRSRLDGLYDEEQTVLAEYRTGELSAKDYLLRTTFLDARVTQYMETLSVIEAEGERIQAAAIGRDVEELRTMATVIGGPIQQRVGRAYRGEIGPASVRVDAGSGGYVVVTIVGDAVVRQSHRYDRRAPPDDPTNDLRSALDQVYAQYPDETSQVGSISVGGQQPTGVFYVTITTSSDVTLTSYVDNRNLTVFKEVYRQPLEQLSVDPGPGLEQNGLRLQVNPSPTAGLIRVETTDAESGEPLDADLSVSGSPVGSTGPDGVAWVADPPGPTNVTASVGTNQSVSTQLP